MRYDEVMGALRALQTRQRAVRRQSAIRAWRRGAASKLAMKGLRSTKTRRLAPKLKGSLAWYARRISADAVKEELALWFSSPGFSNGAL